MNRLTINSYEGEGRMLGFHKEDQLHLRQLIFLRKSDCFGCAVLVCFVCLFDLACFFLLSSSLINMYTCNVHVYYTCNDLVMLVHQLLSGGVGVRATGPVGSRETAECVRKYIAHSLPPFLPPNHLSLFPSSLSPSSSSSSFLCIQCT